MGRVLRDLFIQNTAFQLGGRDLGGYGGLRLIRIGKFQQRRIKGRLLRRFLRPVSHLPGPLTEFFTVMEKYLPGTGIPGI